MEHFAQSFEANEQNVEKNPADLKHMNTIHVSITSRGVYGWFGYGVWWKTCHIISRIMKL